MPRPRTLSARELNRALLARQMLLERTAAGLPRALERMGGLQAQYAPSMYIGLWTRVRDLDRATLTRALERRTVVQATLMRATIHLVARGDYWPFELAVRDARRDWAMRAMAGAPTARRMRAAAARARELMAEGPLSRAELERELGKPEFRLLGMWLDLVRVPPAGTWERRRADLLGLAEWWVGPPGGHDEAAGTELLVRRYLAAFGPSTRHEVADFCALPLQRVDAALAGLELRRFRAEDDAPLVDLPRAPLPPADTPAPVRFLPTWDATLLVHARRAQILPERHRKRIFSTKMPQSVGTFLVDGAVAGTWRPRDGRIEIEPFEPLSASRRREVDAEAERLLGFLA
ncbi:MAG TPA: winged helix DNA-binding domain-containing protein [Thermoleophilaceae bacterium]|nr:winged helix DNA-binding domain-containing protein [Thermoleophilaceae bacterium]